MAQLSPPYKTRCEALLKTSSVVLAAAALAGCAGVVKPTASGELNRAVDRLTTIQASVTEESVRSTPGSEIPVLVRALARRYDRLAGDVGQMRIEDRSPEEQGAWQALQRLASERAMHLKDLASQMESAGRSKERMEITNMLQAPFEQMAVDALNDSLSRLKRP